MSIGSSNRRWWDISVGVLLLRRHGRICPGNVAEKGGATEPSCHPGFRLVATTQPPSYPVVIGRFIAPFRRQTHEDGLEVVSAIADKINCCHVYGAPDSPARMSASIS
jgi:hypothetical protein